MSRTSVLDAGKKPTAILAHRPVLAPQRRFDVPGGPETDRLAVSGQQSVVSGQLSAAIGYSFNQIPVQSASVAARSCPPRVQAKIEVGQPDDEYEREADRVADEVMRMPAPCCSGRPDDDDKSKLRRKPDSSLLTAHSSLPRGIEVSPEVEVQIQSLRGGGRPLSESERAFFEPRFGHDFSHVRAHTDAEAVKSSRAVNALAYTVKDDIVFGSGEYQPRTSSGQQLLAHELAHVVQQGLASDNRRLRFAVLQKQSFPSSGPGVYDEPDKQPEGITRFEQAKHGYGLECLGASIMYMIQSYGLVPPDMSRQEFEHAFTPLNPFENPKTSCIKVGGKGQKDAMSVDLFSEALEESTSPPKVPTSIGKVTMTEATLRGALTGGFSPQYVVKKLPLILGAFKTQSEKPNYEFMQVHRPPAKLHEPEGNKEWITTNDLNSNAISSEYFGEGDTLLAELSLFYPAKPEVEHRCVIVAPAKYTIKDTAGQNHYLCPADDPWYGPTLVVVPPDTDGSLKKQPGFSVTDPYNGLLEYNGHKVLQVAKGNNHVYRRGKTARP